MGLRSAGARVMLAAAKALSGNARLLRYLEVVAEAERRFWPDLSRFEQQAEMFQRSPWVYTAVSLIASAGALAELQVMRRVNEKLQPVDDHAIERLLRRPNAFQSAFEFMEASIGFWRLTGNCYWFLSGPGGGKPDEIYPLRPDRVTVLAGVSNRSHVIGYLYEVEGMTVPFERGEIIHFKRFHPLLDYYGMSSLEPAAMAVYADHAMATWNRDYFSKDHTIPAGIVNIKTMVSDADFQRIKEEFKESYGEGQRRTAFVRGSDISFQGMAPSQRDMDFVAGRQFDKDLIFQTFNIPPGLLDKNSTEANAKVAREMFEDFAVWPTLVGMASKLTSELAPFWGMDLEVKPKEIRRKDSTQDRAEVQTYGEYMTINEVRTRYLNLEPVSWGDERRNAPRPAALPVSPATPLLPSGEGKAVEVPDVVVTRAARAEVAQYASFAAKRLGSSALDSFTFRSTPEPLQIAVKALVDVSTNRHDLLLLGDRPASYQPTPGLSDLRGVVASFLGRVRADVSDGIHSLARNTAIERVSDVTNDFNGAWWQRHTADLVSMTRSVVQDTVGQYARAEIDRVYIQHGYTIDPAELLGPAARYTNAWASTEPLSFVAITREGFAALVQRWMQVGSDPSQLLAAINLSQLFSPERAALFARTEIGRLAAAGVQIAASRLAHSLGVGGVPTQAQVNRLIPAHQGCQCGVMSIPVYDEALNLLRFDLRYIAGGKSPCPVCAGRDGLLVSDILGRPSDE